MMIVAHLDHCFGECADGPTEFCVDYAAKKNRHQARDVFLADMGATVGKGYKSCGNAN